MGLIMRACSKISEESQEAQQHVSWEVLREWFVNLWVWSLNSNRKIRDVGDVRVIGYLLRKVPGTEGIQHKREAMCTLDNRAIGVGQPKPTLAQVMTPNPQIPNLELWGFHAPCDFFLPFLVSCSSNSQECLLWNKSLYSALLYIGTIIMHFLV